MEKGHGGYPWPFLFAYCRNTGGPDLHHKDRSLPSFIAVQKEFYLSTHMAMPMPPPMHSVARPFFASRFCIS
jgi:hypothetical protein